MTKNTETRTERHYRCAFLTGRRHVSVGSLDTQVMEEGKVLDVKTVQNTQELFSCMLLSHAQQLS